MSALRMFVDNPLARITFAAKPRGWHRRGDAQSTSLRKALNDESPDVRLFAVRWIADERIMALRDDVAKLLDGPQPNPRLYLAVLGAIDWLDHEPSHRERRNQPTSFWCASCRTTSARRRPTRWHFGCYLKPDNKFLTLDRLRRISAIRRQAACGWKPSARSPAVESTARFELVWRKSRSTTQQSDDVRAEAIVGLAPAEAASSAAALRNLVGQRTIPCSSVKPSVLCGWRGSAAADRNEAGRSRIAAWTKVLAQAGDAAAGRRLFFSPVGPRCSVCHKYDGRGGNVGPDLTHIGRSTSRERIITSILQPSQEIAPDYQPWMLVTSDGKTYTGLRLPKPGDDGKEDYVDSAGHVFTLPSASIEERHAATTSIMPENLQSTLSIGDLRDLVAFLTSRPSPE